MGHCFADGKAELMAVQLTLKQKGDQLAGGFGLRAGLCRGIEPVGVMLTQSIDPVMKPIKRPVMRWQDKSILWQVTKFFEAIEIELQRIAFGLIALQAYIGGYAGVVPDPLKSGR